MRVRDETNETMFALLSSSAPTAAIRRARRAGLTLDGKTYPLRIMLADVEIDMRGHLPWPRFS